MRKERKGRGKIERENKGDQREGRAEKGEAEKGRKGKKYREYINRKEETKIG